MNEANLISQGFQLMLVGMGMVFIFLTVLVFITSLLEKVLAEPPKAPVIKNNNNQISSDEIAAISSAIHSFRSRHSKQ